MYINFSYTLATWPTAVYVDNVVFERRTTVYLVLAIILILLLIGLCVECCCVPMLFCDAYWLYTEPWWPRYPSRRHLPSVFRLHYNPLWAETIRMQGHMEDAAVERKVVRQLIREGFNPHKTSASASTSTTTLTPETEVAVAQQGLSFF